jgi:hypothetical protein
VQNTPGYVLNYGIAGNAFTTCDTGGFEGQTNALLLARWYGVSTFIPLMRIHSRINWVPHFPFEELWGAEAAAAMGAFLRLRYALLPYSYSLGHVAAATGLSPARPLRLEFPGDASVAALTREWMYGDALLVAPVLTPDNATAVILPALSGGARWFEWGSAVAHAGGATLALASVPLDVVPAYARSGGIFTLAPPVQYSDALPGGPLDVRVYAGADGAFTLYEDDGETTAYATAGAVATLALSWDDAAGCLSWARGGVTGAGGAQAFVALRVTAYFASGETRAAPVQAIGAAGRACPAAAPAARGEAAAAAAAPAAAFSFAYERVALPTNVTLSVLFAGAARGGATPVILFLHGFPEGSWSWSQVLSSGLLDDHVLAAPDQRGYNASSLAPTYALSALVADATALAAVLAEGGAPVHWVAHDWGGAVAWAAAAADAAGAIASLTMYVTARHAAPPAAAPATVTLTNPQTSTNCAPHGP